MKKQIIKINESHLRKIISESIKKVLSEGDFDGDLCIRIPPVQGFGQSSGTTTNFKNLKRLLLINIKEAFVIRKKNIIEPELAAQI